MSDEKRHAILVGNATYTKASGLNDLRFPTRDVDGWKTVLGDPQRGGFSRIVEMKDRPSHEITREIQKTLRGLSREDLLLFYYSGHGLVNLNGELYLASADTDQELLETSAVPMGMIRDLLKTSPVTKIILILDCCFSGSAGTSFAKSSIKDAVQATGRARGTYLLTASTGAQTALEKEADEYSVFTKHLLHGLRSGEADVDGNGRVTVEEMFHHARRKVLADSHQEPTISAFEVHDTIEISLSGREPRRDRAQKLKKLLHSLAADDRISDSVLNEALRIIRTVPHEQAPLDASRDALLTRLLDKHLTAADFLGEWFTTAPAPLPTATVPPPLTKQPVPESPSLPVPSLQSQKPKPSEPVKPAPKPKPKPEHEASLVSRNQSALIPPKPRARPRSSSAGVATGIAASIGDDILDTPSRGPVYTRIEGWLQRFVDGRITKATLAMAVAMGVTIFLGHATHYVLVRLYTAVTDINLRFGLINIGCSIAMAAVFGVLCRCLHPGITRRRVAALCAATLIAPLVVALTMSPLLSMGMPPGVIIIAANIIQASIRPLVLWNPRTLLTTRQSVVLYALGTVLGTLADLFARFVGNQPEFVERTSELGSLIGSLLALPLGVAVAYAFFRAIEHAANRAR